MGVEVEKLRLPVSFEQDDEVSDSRFKKVKIWVAHTGENLNNSYFEKSTLEQMAKTLSGVPIVGFIEADDEDEDDFSDHRQEIIIKDGGVNIKYAGHAYGFIPKENNHAFEYRNGKEWLTAEGYLWTKFTDMIDIFQEQSGIKSQSMEIINVEAQTDDIGRLDIKSAVFDALCILGEKVPPAMAGSTIEFFSKSEGYHREVEKLMMAFELEKGVEELPQTKDEELKTEIEELTDETVEVEEVVEEVEAVEEGEGIAEEFSAEEDVAIDEPAIEEEVETEPEVEAEAEPEAGLETEEESEEDEQLKLFNMNFEMNHDSIRYKLSQSLVSTLGESQWGYISEVFDNHAIAYIEDYEVGKKEYRKVFYEKGEDFVNITNDIEVFPTFLTKEEVDSVEDKRKRTAELEEELKALQEFKAEIEDAKKSDLLEEFSEKVASEDIETIRENIANFSLDDIEKELGLALYRFEKSNSNTNATGVVPVAKLGRTEGVYGEIDKYFI